MKIFELLFYCSYKLGEKSGNFNDDPIFGVLMGLIVPFVLMEMSVLSFLEGIIKVKLIYQNPGNRYSPFNIIISVITLFFLYFYYRYKKRHLQIAKKYDQKNYSVWFLILILVAYFITSILLLIVSSEFQKREWILAGISY